MNRLIKGYGREKRLGTEGKKISRHTKCLVQTANRLLKSLSMRPHSVTLQKY
jgi:hypothetical protein